METPEVSFNKLSPAEAERLYILAEEASEVVKAVTKILRHGYASYNPDEPTRGDNRDQLEDEIADLMGAVSLMEREGDIDINTVVEKIAIRTCTKRTYLHHNGPLTVEDMEDVLRAAEGRIEE